MLAPEYDPPFSREQFAKNLLTSKKPLSLFVYDALCGRPNFFSLCSRAFYAFEDPS